MYACLIEFLCEILTRLARPVVRIVDDDLSAGLKERPDRTLAPFPHALPQTHRLGRLLT